MEPIATYIAGGYHHLRARLWLYSLGDQDIVRFTICPWKRGEPEELVTNTIFVTTPRSTVAKRVVAISIGIVVKPVSYPGCEVSKPLGQLRNPVGQKSKSTRAHSKIPDRTARFLTDTKVTGGVIMLIVVVVGFLARVAIVLTSPYERGVGLGSRRIPC